MICHSTQSDDYLWHLICVENKELKKLKHPNTKFLPIFEMVGTKNFNSRFKKEIIRRGEAELRTISGTQ